MNIDKKIALFETLSQEAKEKRIQAQPKNGYDRSPGRDYQPAPFKLENSARLRSHRNSAQEKTVQVHYKADLAKKQTFLDSVTQQQNARTLQSHRSDISPRK